MCLIMKKEKFIKMYSTAIMNNDAAIFAGAGLSKSAGFVDWNQLINPFASEIGLDSNKENDLTQIAQYYVNENLGNRSEINERILNAFSPLTSVPENIKILSRLPIETFWTTNYDSLLETGLGQNNKLVDIKNSPQKLNHNLHHRDATVYKMHGDAHDPVDAVLIKDDYESYENKYGLFRTFLKADLLSKTFLFIGFSFDDPNLQYVLAQIRLSFLNDSRTHYCFLKEITKQNNEKEEDFNYRRIKQNLKIHDLSRYGIKTILLKDYAEITSILKEIESVYLRNNIFVSGSISHYSDKWSKESVERLSYELGKTLVAKNYKVISGFGLGIGSSIINGALDEIFKTKNNHIDDFLKLYPFPQVDNKKSSWKKYRTNMIDHSGICIFLFGNKFSPKKKNVDSKGVFQEFEIAKRKKKIIIPIGSTGYASEKILKEITNNN